MTGKDLTDLLKYPDHLKRDDRSVLKDLVGRFPYCSVAQVLYAFNLYKGNDLEYGSRLKIAAAYTASRSKMKILFEQLRNPEPVATVPSAETSGKKDHEIGIPLLTKEEIIEKFIREEPKITPPRATFFNPTDHAYQSNHDEDDIVSETLAELFIRQGNIHKAIRIYERLSLLFPEKSVYFAAQIEKLGG